MTPEEIKAWLRRSGIASDAVSVERIAGGSLNEVFRARVGDERLIVKYVPPYVSSDPTIALSPRRLLIEARCLRELAFGGALADVSSRGVRTPRLRVLDEVARILAMQDVGALADLDTAMRGNDSVDPDLGTRLGSFIGC